MIRRFLLVLLAAFVALLWTLPASSRSADSNAATWIAALRGAGHVIIIRHGATHADQADTDPLNISAC